MRRTLTDESRELCGARPASAQDHERDPLGQRDERAGALAVGRADETDSLRREAGGRERRPEHLVDEDGDRAQRRAPGPQHRCVQALQQLPGDVEGDVRPGLEVRADGADRDPPHRHAEAVLELPTVLVALEWWERGELCELLGQRLDPRRVEPQAVERAGVEPAGGFDVRGVRCGDRVPSLADESRRPVQGIGHRVVGQERNRRRRGRSLALELVAQAHGSNATTLRSD